MRASIRPPRGSDIDEIRDLLGQLGYDVDLNTLKRRLAGILDREDQLFRVADLNGGCVGWVHATVADYLDSGPFVVIGGLVVDRTCRGQGIGKALMNVAEQWTLAQGRTILRVWSSAPREEAHAFYKHLGFSHIKTHFAFAKSLAPESDASRKKMVPRISERPEGDS